MTDENINDAQFAESIQNETVAQPVQVDAYQTIIAQQQDQINALIAQTNAQSAQITQLIQSGAQIAPQPQPQQPQQPMAHAAPKRGYAPVSQPLNGQYPNYYEPDNAMGKFNAASLADEQDWTLEGLAGEIGKK